MLSNMHHIYIHLCAMNDNFFVCFIKNVSNNIGDGLIQHRELQHVMRACMEENGMQFSEDQVSGHIYQNFF